MVDIDLDDYLTAQLAPYFSPFTGMIGREATVPLRLAGIAPTRCCPLRVHLPRQIQLDRVWLLEIPCGPRLTMVAPSIHPSGGTYLASIAAAATASRAPAACKQFSTSGLFTSRALSPCCTFVKLVLIEE
ncbi:MAG: hypothetical protein RMJ88_07445 [Thermogemmata sp.]|nr:hypothetical protein [Thermogemmata sp.]